MIRNASEIDIEEILILHKRVFDNSYFSIHYSDSLLKEYFKSLFKLNEYCYIARDENQNLVGYLIGGYRSQEAVDIFMREHFFKVLLCMLKRPKFIYSGIGKIIRKIKPNRITSTVKLRLFLIGVDLKVCNKGIGRSLIAKFEEDLLTNGIDVYGLYVRNNNYNAIRFYERKGFKQEFRISDLICYYKRL